MRLLIAVAFLLGSVVAASACGDSFGHARRGACAYHRGIERLWNPDRRGYRYWDGPLSDEGTRYYGENGGTGAEGLWRASVGYGMKPAKCARISAVAAQTAILNVSIQRRRAREGLVGKC
jgi:hypothetical protein